MLKDGMKKAMKRSFKMVMSYFFFFLVPINPGADKYLHFPLIKASALEL